jgi:hypothetical protein
VRQPGGHPDRPCCPFADFVSEQVNDPWVLRSQQCARTGRQDCHCRAPSAMSEANALWSGWSPTRQRFTTALSTPLGQTVRDRGAVRRLGEDDRGPNEDYIVANLGSVDVSGGQMKPSVPEANHALTCGFTWSG